VQSPGEPICTPRVANMWLQGRGGPCWVASDQASVLCGRSPRAVGGLGVAGLKRFFELQARVAAVAIQPGVAVPTADVGNLLLVIVLEAATLRLCSCALCASCSVLGASGCPAGVALVLF
jgi:hypothetical protein